MSTNQIHNEQVKLTAAWFNNLGVGIVLSGVLIPILTDAVPRGAIGRVGLMFVAIGAGWSLNLLARSVIKNKLRDFE
jgi:hypothetical protein